ncbi:MAG: aminoglycoside 6-adenylyltransferase [Anaerolineae bacterium]|nr:aminoglycoside 6-adenylyltransferase [Anaerolineae bacterium]
MMNEEAVLTRLIEWGSQLESVRAMILTSTRTNPHKKLDPFSDYDVIVVVNDDVRAWAEPDTWLEDFGPVMVVYRDPVYADVHGEQFGRVTMYQDGTKIDYTIMALGIWQATVAEPKLPDDLDIGYIGRRMTACKYTAEPKLPDDLDIGYRVLLDKDHLTDGLQPPTYRAYIPKPPTADQYRAVIDDFFSDSTYVAKNLWRGELFFWKYCLDDIMKGKKLREMLEWRMEMAHNWSVPTGVLGKGLRKNLPNPDIWQALEATYVGADPAENWTALFGTIELFRRVAMEVGEHLGYAYPHEMDAQVCAYLRGVREMPK